MVGLAHTQRDVFECPACRAPLSVPLAGETRCQGCGRVFESREGVIDLVSGPDRADERAHYDQYYGASASRERTSPHDLDRLAANWTGPDAPWEMERVWAHLGDIAGKTVLLLGNGESQAELYMLTRDPGMLIYSDLSPVGLSTIAGGLGERENVLFAAIDALDLPIRDGSVDLVYGFAFVHHLPDLDRFFSEVARVLRPGGRAVFMDNGHSPLWQHLKLIWLRPLMAFSHRRDPRSPEDVRDTMAGGFREEMLAVRIRATGAQPWFERVAFLYWFWMRASVSLFPGLFARVPKRELIARGLRAIDARLARLPFVRQNMIRLVWGLDRPHVSGD